MIPDEKINDLLHVYFGESTPGDELHHLVLATTAPDEVNALGLPDPDKMRMSVFAIAPVGSEEDPGRFVAKSIIGATVEMAQRRHVVHFAVLTMEIHTIPKDGNEVTENRARRMSADNVLHEHPDAVEATQLYAACRDGRRWHGQHILTGPHAGTVIGPELLHGPITDDEDALWPRLVRQAVGI